MYVVTVEFTVAPQHQQAFATAVDLQAKNSVQLESECHRFDVCVGNDSENDFFLYEIYSDAAAFDAHLASEHFKDFNALVTPWVVNKTVASWRLRGQSE